MRLFFLLIQMRSSSNLLHMYITNIFILIAGVLQIFNIWVHDCVAY